MEACWEVLCEILTLGNWRGRGTHQDSYSVDITVNQFIVNKGILARGQTGLDGQTSMT